MDIVGSLDRAVVKLGSINHEMSGFNPSIDRFLCSFCLQKIGFKEKIYESKIILYSGQGEKPICVFCSLFVSLVCIHCV